MRHINEILPGVIKRIGERWEKAELEASRAKENLTAKEKRAADGLAAIKKLREEVGL